VILVLKRIMLDFGGEGAEIHESSGSEVDDDKDTFWPKIELGPNASLGERFLEQS
jgi:hypothetical protein